MARGGEGRVRMAKGRVCAGGGGVVAVVEGTGDEQDQRPKGEGTTGRKGR